MSDLEKNYGKAPISSSEQKSEAPNATVALVLGIISIVTSLCYGIPGLICGIIALILAAKGVKMVASNPNQYTESSVKNLNAGKICGIIGTIFSSLIILVFAVYIFILGAAIATTGSILNEESNKLKQEFIEQMQDGFNE